MARSKSVLTIKKPDLISLPLWPIFSVILARMCLLILVLVVSICSRKALGQMQNVFSPRYMRATLVGLMAIVGNKKQQPQPS